jgi:hypothetical protein
MSDLKQASPEISSDRSMPKDQKILGMLLQIDLSKTFAELAGERIVLSLVRAIEHSLQSILKSLNLSQVDVISTMLDDLTKPITTVTFYAQKKIPEKSGLM